MNKKIPELVLPAGDLHRVKIAFLYGADAVYVGLDKYSLRKAEVRFSIPEIKKAIKHAHGINKKIYITFNIFAHNKHIKSLARDMHEIAKAKPDAFIISDTGVISIARKVVPRVPIHLSTQANTINYESVNFWLREGIKRVVLAREATLSEIKEIKKLVPKMELEIFVHGAMCISYSGRCLMSSFMAGRSSNLGECAQPCRWQYKLISENEKVKNFSGSLRNIPGSSAFLEESKRKGEYYPIEEDSHGTYIMNSKDLCLIEHLDKIAPYVDALKIEGRNKTDYYLASVGSLYRTGLNSLSDGTYNSKYRNKLMVEAEKITHRGYTTGFLFGDAKKGETFSKREPIIGKRYLGYVESSKLLEVRPPTIGEYISRIVVKNKLEVGKTYEILAPDRLISFKILAMFDRNKKPIQTANPGRTNEKVYIEANKNLPINSFIRESG